MADYFDKDVKELQKGFYKKLNCDSIFYFTGKYEDGLAVFEKENELGKERLFYHTTVNQLSRVSNEEASQELENLKNKTNWLEGKL